MSNQSTLHDTERTAPLCDENILAVFSTAARVSLAAGERITPMKDEVLLLEEGDLLHYHEGRLLEIVTSVRILGLAEVLVHKHLAGTFQARNASRLLRLSGHTLRTAMQEQPALLERVLAHLAQSVVEHARDKRNFAMAYDEVFAPEVGASLLPGPNRFGPYRATQIVMEAKPAEIDALLPEGLSRIPGLGGRYMILINDLRGCVNEHEASDGRAFEYQEVLTFIPCVSASGKVGLYTPEVYPSACMPVLIGREIYGFPKRMARVCMSDKRVDLLADNVVLLHAQWARETPVSAGEFIGELSSVLLPQGRTFASTAKMLGTLMSLAERVGVAPRPIPASVFVRKRIKRADARRLNDDALDQLIQIPFVLTHMSNPVRLQGINLEAHAKSRVFPGRVIAGYSSLIGFRMEAGRVECDYLEKSSGYGFLSRLVA